MFFRTRFILETIKSNVSILFASFETVHFVYFVTQVFTIANTTTIIHLVIVFSLRLKTKTLAN